MKSKKSSKQIRREVDDFLRTAGKGRRMHHATVSASASGDEWDVAMDAILEHEPKQIRRAAKIVHSIYKSSPAILQWIVGYGSGIGKWPLPQYWPAAFASEAWPDRFANALAEAPNSVGLAFAQQLKKLSPASTNLDPEVHRALVLGLKSGAKVVANGYPGRVVRVTPYDMIEVRLPGGVVAVSASDVTIPGVSQGNN